MSAITLTVQDRIKYYMCHGMTKEEAIRCVETKLRIKLPETVKI
jgi:uncharacterized protein YoaH (UPF0181 family)